MILCNHCSVEQPEDAFRKGRRVCRKCQTAKAREFDAKYPERKRGYNRKWIAKYKGVAGYRIPNEQFAEMMRKQGGRCAICETDKPDPNRSRFCVDHCHTTGVIRGLLCHLCNAALGMFKDDSVRVKRALDYLENGPRVHVPEKEAGGASI